MVRSSTKCRGLSSNASKGIDVSQTHQDLQLDNVRGIGACRKQNVSEGSEAPEGCLRNEVGARRADAAEFIKSLFMVKPIFVYNAIYKTVPLFDIDHHHTSIPIFNMISAAAFASPMAS